MTKIDKPYLDVEKARPRREAVEDATRIVAAEYGLPSAELIGRGRTKSVSEARQMAYCLLRDFAKMSFPEIGAAFGRDHTTIMMGVRNIARLIQLDPYAASAFYRMRGAFRDAREARRVA